MESASFVFDEIVKHIQSDAPEIQNTYLMG
jgi:hypothetical protein